MTAGISRATVALKESELQVLALMCACVDDPELQPRGGQSLFEALFGAGQLPIAPALPAADRRTPATAAAVAAVAGGTAPADVLARTVVDDL